MSCRSDRKKLPVEKGDVMRIKSIFFMLALTAASITFGFNEAKAAFSAEIGTPNVNFRISDFQPAPPGVYVQSDAGRPYYMERDRRVYMEKKKHGKRYKKEKHHEDHGRKNGHDKHK
jgi:hypothetical protein